MLYATQNVVCDAALKALPHLSVMEDLDTVPTVEELSKAINCLTGGKAPRKDGIPPEVLKSGKSPLLWHLHELLSLCLEKGYIPHDMHDTNLITLYKNKCDCSDCNIYGGIFLLGIVVKVFIWVVFAHLQSLMSWVYPETQCGFTAGSSEVDMILLCQLQESAKSSICHSVSHSSTCQNCLIWSAKTDSSSFCKRPAALPKLYNMITSSHKDMHSTVCFNGATWEVFLEHSGVKQGCVLALTFTRIFFSMLLQCIFTDCTRGIWAFHLSYSTSLASAWEQR